MPDQRGAAPGDDRAATLDHLGIRPGELIRWRRRPADRWQSGTAAGVERDGSLAIRDTKGAARAIPLDLVEVAAPPRRKGAKPGWEPLLARAERTEQLQLETDPTAARHNRRPPHRR